MIRKKSMFLFLFVGSLVYCTSFVLTGCNHYVQEEAKRVFIKKDNGRYQFCRDGKPFVVKGVAGYTYLKALSECGGNTIRTWDTTNLDVILKQANQYHLAVIVGLYIPDNKDMLYFYQDEEKIQKQLENFTAFIRKYKKDSAILCWCLGNELTFPFKPQFNPFYKAFNNLVKMIHKEDPDHPVTTTMVNFQRKNIFNIKFRTDVDFISINTFGGLRFLKKDIDNFSWLWNGPFLITEWAIDGPWGEAAQSRNKWGSYFESNSNKKANDYIKMYQKYIPNDNPRFLGDLAFYWGYKQEYTHTWFSIFDENGNVSEAKSALRFIWTSKKDNESYPSVNTISINHWPINTDFIFNADSILTAKVLFSDNRNIKRLKIKWEILPEDWYTINTIHSLQKPIPLNLIEKDYLPEIKFKTPAKEGPYRIFVKAIDSLGHFATCNLPFYVVENK